LFVQGNMQQAQRLLDAHGLLPAQPREP
jgi:hypothetical protein